MSETVIAGRYRLDRLLGHGGMSEVWQATDLELDRRVALKLLAPDADTARFEREARAVAALGHANVTQLYDYGEADGRPYMVLEYLTGGTLQDRLRPGVPLPDGDTHAIAADIAAGLAHAHARGVVHRDLKPANILFDEEGRAKVGDFGIARLAAGEGTLTEAGTVLGTAAYISPEQAAGEPATAASDVYSFGVILYRMLTGRLPFESDDPLELVLLHRDAEPPPLSALRETVPPLLAATATAALAKDPARRPPDGAALVAALGGGAPAPLAATDSTRVLAAAPPPPPPRRRSLAPLVVLALIALAFAGGALAWELTRTTDSSTSTGTLPAPTAATGPTTSTPSTTARTTTAGTTTAAATQPTTHAATTHSAPTPPPPTIPTTRIVTTAPATTAPPPPTTTAPPSPTTTAPPPTTTAAATAGP